MPHRAVTDVPLILISMPESSIIGVRRSYVSGAAEELYCGYGEVDFGNEREKRRDT